MEFGDGVVFDDYLIEDLLPGPVEGPFLEPLMRGLPGTVAFGEIPPRSPGADLPEDGVDHLPVITPFPATAVGW